MYGAVGRRSELDVLKRWNDYSCTRFILLIAFGQWTVDENEDSTSSRRSSEMGNGKWEILDLEIQKKDHVFVFVLDITA